MRNLIWLTTLIFLALCLQAQAMELKPLADCSIKIFREINRSQIWSGKPPTGCVAGIFVTTWNSGKSEQGWEKITSLTHLSCISGLGG